MLRIGITGGIGSGKSTVARIFEVLGIPVYYADTEAKRLMETDPQIRAGIEAAFGAQMYADGKLQRSLLSAQVFSDASKLATLNAIVHPVTLSHARSWMERQEAPYVMKEAALIFESGAQADLDLVLGVSAPQSLRIHRVMKRDQVSREDVLARIDKQMDESIKMKLCDAVILNNDQEALIPQVMSWHQVWINERK
jgi:dephospho-CoA kinase